jgi:hypothetical protein
MTPVEFRRLCPALEHYAPSGFLRVEYGLLTAAQLLDLNSDHHGMVSARFCHQSEFESFDRDYWKTHSRFRRRAGEDGCNVIVRHPSDPSRRFFLGNNYPLGEGTCIGTSLPLTDNRPEEPQPTREDWFRTLNNMFWVFDANNVNPGVLTHLRAASHDGTLTKATLVTAGLSDRFIENKIKLSAINGGGSNGALPRGTLTYKRPSEWTRAWPPKEIGIIDGLEVDLCRALMTDGTLTLSET